MEEYKSRGVVALTISYTESRLDRWGRRLKRRRPRVVIEHIDADTITRHMEACASFRSKSTVYGMLSTMRGSGDNLVRQGLWKINPLRWMKGPKIIPRSRLPKRIDQAHMEALWRAAAQSRETSTRLITIRMMPPSVVCWARPARALCKLVRAASSDNNDIAEPGKSIGWLRVPPPVLKTMRSTVRVAVSFGLALVTAFADGQLSATLKTSDTELRLESSTSQPRLVSLRHQAQRAWLNRVSERLIETVEVGGETLRVSWVLNREASRISTSSISWVFDSASPQMRLSWNWDARSERGPIEHDIRIENLDSREIWLPLQNSFAFDWDIPPGDSLEQFYIEKGADTPSAAGTHQVPIADGSRWEGTSSTYAHPGPGEAREIIPYVLVERTGAARSGYYIGIEFSGRTHLQVARTGNSLRGEVGLNPNPGPYRTRLEPGETFETPRIFLGANSGGPDAAGNTLRPWIREVLGNTEAWNDPQYPLAVNNSWGGGTAVNEEIARRMIRDAADLGFEMFHIDAGWFRGVGDWYPDSKKFPNGLASVADDAHAHGLRFGLWVDWTQAALDTEPGALNVWNPEVRGWLTTDLPATWKPEEFKGQPIDIGVPTAKTWAQKETDRIVSDYKLDMLEHDGYLVAQGCDKDDHPHAAADPLNKCTYRDAGFVFVRSSNSTDVSYHAVRAYYEIQSHLRANHRGLLLEVCNDGGRMVDFGSAAHGDYFSITDTYDPLSNRRAFYDASFVLPAAMLEAYVERWPAPRIENFRYMLRSGMMGWFTLMLDTTVWDAEHRDAAKEEIHLYKSELRSFIRDAHLYHVSQRPDGVHWDGMEYLDSARQHGVVYVFRGSIASENEHTFLLYGLQPNGSYEVRFHDHSAADAVFRGSQLRDRGLRVKLLLPNSSEIIFLEEVPGQQISTSGEKRKPA